MKKVNKIL